MNALKPCPFCGSAPHVYEDARFVTKMYNFPKFYIACLGCGVKTPVAKVEQVVKIWNSRVEGGKNDSFILS